MMTIEELYELILRKDPEAKRDGCAISSSRSLDLRSLTALPKGVALSAGGTLYLPSLTVLPEDVSLSAGSWLYLDSLQSEYQVYQGRRIRLRMIDGRTMRLLSSRTLADGITLWQAQHFLGHMDTDPGCFVAQRGDFYAHGKTAGRAVRDLRFKEAAVARTVWRRPVR
jgi:hypothetical protein